jgi:hypothetical protein
METYTQSRPLVSNPLYQEQRADSLHGLDFNTIDAPIADVIKGLAELPYCFTLQSCYGHFLGNEQSDPKNLDPVVNLDKASSVEYRIAYIALCIQNSESGIKLLQDLEDLTRIDPDYIQFGCAEWFWERQVNSYVLQVEPERYKMRDKVGVSFQEALHIERVRDRFFHELRKMVHERNSRQKGGRFP